MSEPSDPDTFEGGNNGDQGDVESAEGGPCDNVCGYHPCRCETGAEPVYIAALRPKRAPAILPTCGDCAHCQRSRGITSYVANSGICMHPVIVAPEGESRADRRRLRATRLRCVGALHAPPTWCPFRVRS